ncbi:MAG: phospholipid carrier-dependent glycosyltransferase [Sphingobacteriia bacterium]|nr:phospholipid carrier-dependent glycosyltransferase [Sphingobacteriia bacterium]
MKIMKHQWLKGYYHELILLLVIIALIVIKLPHLYLPYYGDEGFAFGPAVHLMYQNGPTILPGGLEPDYSYGHPLLFHFLVASWMKIFGESIVVAKSFALFVSILLLIAIFFTGKTLFNKDAGLLAAILLFFQPIFLAQSSFVLLEAFLALLGLLTILLFFQKKWLLYSLTASALVMTKESGLFLVFALCIWQLMDVFLEKESHYSARKMINSFLIILVPAMVFGLFLIQQKLTWDWFLFPGRMEDMQLTYDNISRNLEHIRKIIFFIHGRNWLVIGLLFSLVGYYFIPGKRFTWHQWKLIWFTTLFIGIFWFMSSLNFISNRYFLIVITMLVLLIAAITVQAFQGKKWLLFPVMIALVVSQSIFAFRHYSTGDDNLGFTDVVEVHRDAVQYMEKSNLRNTYLYAHFLMLYNLQHPISGYLSDGQVFTNLTGIYTDSVEYAVISNVELGPELDSIRRLPHLELMHRVEKGLAWTEIYENRLKVE